ncbi:sarcosine oxidase subunit gamma [Epibacterium sp. SM1969]|uniref:Sarcosine oxidase subunit gamma n=1 Tax=Tritonibacter aquimaris TaxID=2663379 RepID=A0A844AR98_9RHOB|nr:sarcosine oxidase subunit gamma family protein [Tritonibacter aquimaris]MQY43513.1 sarcosine oxidase subunit gamma [Tritonibacter aquimaris]
MANSTSPLQSSRRLGQFGRAGTIGVTIEEVTGFGMVQCAAWGATLAQVGAAAAAAAGCETAPQPGQCHAGTGAFLLRVEPLKWWLVAAPGAEVPTPTVAPEEGAVLDLQDGRCWLRISGAQAETLLNHFLPLDLRPAAFPVGAVASTAFHHTGVTLWRTEEHFNLLIPRSSAQSLWELLSESARQYGLAET